MPRYVAVLPWVYQPFRDEFMKTCKLEVLEIDNSYKNLGIMRSHNIGIDKMREENADWLIVMSAAIRFGETGGLDFIAQLDPEFICIGAADKKKWDNEAQVGIFGWHLIAFSRECIEKVGKWDANFSPYGWDDIDYSIRMQKAFPDPEYSRRTKKVSVDVSDTIMAHSINLAGVRTDNNHHVEYIKKKWNYDVGGDNPLTKMYDHPFRDSAKSLSWWPTYEGSSCL